MDFSTDQFSEEELAFRHKRIKFLLDSLVLNKMFLPIKIPLIVFETWAISGAVFDRYDVPPVLGVLLSLLIAGTANYNLRFPLFLPFLGAKCAAYGACETWDWSFWPGFILFSLWPIFFYCLTCYLVHRLYGRWD